MSTFVWNNFKELFDYFEDKDTFDSLPGNVKEAYIRAFLSRIYYSVYVPTKKKTPKKLLNCGDRHKAVADWVSQNKAGCGSIIKALYELRTLSDYFDNSTMKPDEIKRIALLKDKETRSKLLDLCSQYKEDFCI